MDLTLNMDPNWKYDLNLHGYESEFGSEFELEYDLNLNGYESGSESEI